MQSAQFHLFFSSEEKLNDFSLSYEILEGGLFWTTKSLCESKAATFIQMSTIEMCFWSKRTVFLLLSFWLHRFICDWRVQPMRITPDDICEYDDCACTHCYCRRRHSTNTTDCLFTYLSGWLTVIWHRAKPWKGTTSHRCCWREQQNTWYAHVAFLVSCLIHFRFTPSEIFLFSSYTDIGRQGQKNNKSRS